MKIARKALCLLLTLTICFLVAAAPASAEKAEHCETDPVIILQGYSGSPLFENGEQVWGLDFDAVLDLVKTKIPQLLLGVALLFVGEQDYLVDLVGTNFIAVLDKMSINDDGSSKYDLKTLPVKAENLSAAAMKADGHKEYIAEPLVSDEILKYVPDDHCFTFEWDWRYGQVDAAKRLHEFVKDVLKTTGHSKVDIYGLSHGGQLGATYLYYFGEEGLVDNAVLNVPAIGGTSVVTELMDGNINIDFKQIVEFAEIGSRDEMSIEFLLDFIPTGFVDDLAKQLVAKYLLPFFLNFGSIWDFVSLERYDEMKARYLDPVENAALIAASDEMHYNCMKHMSEGLKRAQAVGVDISIMSNTGREIVLGAPINSDYIIDVHSSSGSYCASLGSHFSDGYVQQNTSCNALGHRHISPSFDIDASTAYLPDNTWFTKNQYHGQVWWDTYTRELYIKLLLTDDLENVFSDPDFPQFAIAQNPKDKLFVKFDGSISGYYSDSSKALQITNLSEEYDISLTSVRVNGKLFSDAKFDIDVFRKIAPGETVSVPVSGNFPERAELTVGFVQYKLHPVVCTRTVDFVRD